MILDYKLFTAGQALQPDTLWILEQIPGTVQMADMTLLLEQQGYWPSYNLPYVKTRWSRLVFLGLSRESLKEQVLSVCLFVHPPDEVYH